MITIFHNPRCRKSREAVELIKGSCHELAIVDYQKTPPTENELKSILEKLGMKPGDLVRKNEELYKVAYQGSVYSDDEWIKIMVANPILIERPILFEGNKAILGRDQQTVIEFLK